LASNAMRTYNKVKGYRTYLLKIMVCTIMTWSNKLLSIEAQGTDSQSSPQAPGEVKSRANKDAVHKIKGRKPLKKAAIFLAQIIGIKIRKGRQKTWVPVHIYDPILISGQGHHCRSSTSTNTAKNSDIRPWQSMH